MSRSVSAGPAKKPKISHQTITEKKLLWEQKIQQKFEKINSTLIPIEKFQLFGRENPVDATRNLAHRIVEEIYLQLSDEHAFNRCKAVFLNLGYAEGKNFYLCLVTQTFQVWVVWEKREKTTVESLTADVLALKLLARPRTKQNEAYFMRFEFTPIQNQFNFYNLSAPAILIYVSHPDGKISRILLLKDMLAKTRAS